LSATARLRRLVAAGYLVRRGQWTTGKRGTPPFVYQPKDKGWQLAHKKRHDYRKIHPHFVWTAEAFVELVSAQDRGEIALTEPRLEVPVGGVRADMKVGITKPGDGEPTYFYVEVEVYDAKEAEYIRNKLRGYVAAWDASSGGFPYVIVAAPDDDHRLQIESVLGELSAEDAELFKVCLISGLVATIKAA
jgi:hypothetical protein